jgi:hypothetical protein
MTIIRTRADEITVACTWGDGPDVLCDIKRDGVLIPLDLTTNEAWDLAVALMSAADQAKQLEDLAAKEDLA